MKLLYITDISQLTDYFSDPNSYKDLTIITGDISVAFELETSGVNYVNEWDFLSNKEIENNFDQANVISKKWWNEIYNIHTHDGQHYFSSTCQDMVYSIEAALNSKCIYDSLFSKYKILEIHGFFLKDQAVIKTGPIPTHRAVRSITQAILFWICKKKSIPVFRLVSKYPLSLGRLKQ